MAVKSIPEGYHSITPYLVIKNCSAAIDYYVKAFGAREVVRMDAPGGKIGHAELMFGNSYVMMADEHPDQGHIGPETVGGTPVGLMFYVDDVDAVFNRAVENGATVTEPLENKFYGDRSGSIKDPFGHKWMISTHVEDVTPDEMERRMKAMQGG
jgi:PhnB protein